MISNHNTEILILGGGIAGCIAAISLADTYKVTLVDKLIQPTEKVGESLAPATHRILNTLGLKLSDSEYQNIFINNLGMQSYWGSDQVQIIDHLRNPDGASKSVDRKKLALYLREKAIEKGVDCFWGLRFFNSSYQDNTWNITCKSDDIKNRTTKVFSSKFVIDATGRGAHFAKTQNIKRTKYDSLISCWLSLPNTKQNTMSTIIPDEFGWWYSAVIPNNKRILSYQTDADIIEKSVFKNFSSFSKLIHQNKIANQFIENQTNAIEFHGVVSANSTKLNQVVGQQWLALGDAAISFDPLSSQGMFNAMATAMQVSDLLKKVNISSNLNEEKIAYLSNNYTSQIDSIWNHYLKHKELFYSAETRWKNALFWKRRHENVFVL
ncbi:tryptophan 7-halogenase [uncultured Tenacibaculum sp.]|uniref:tryptophan 7-halogenase n=1 Tax=uncultured Tenacibaculum sp. TaxID=174713 RepID=UPI00261F3328|nr:tryptophan 7-halogenase [uncultured Tenacibaculum sp.]